MNLTKLSRLTYKAARIQRAAAHPDRYVKNRVKSKALKTVGVYRTLNRFWRL
ncbi:MAG: hypothetical protein H0W90_08095 [Actinobacteria bacterium]|nr:hypothetical protein [Actinomycetota bacterium]